MNELLVVATVTSSLLFVWKSTAYLRLHKLTQSITQQLNLALSGLVIANLGKVPKPLEDMIKMKKPVDTLEDTRNLCGEVLDECRRIAEKNGNLD